MAVGTPRTALADTKAAAQKLFDEGAALMAQKNFTAACPKIKASMELEPLDGTVLRLAVCYQAIGRWSAAWGLYKESVVRAEKAKRKDRLDMATKGIAEVEKHLSYVTVHVPPEARLTGLEVKIDGERVVEETFETELPIDPGSHTLSASAIGRRSWETTFSIATTAEKKTVNVPKLEDLPPTAPAPTNTTSTTSSPTVHEPNDVPSPAHSPTMAYVAIGGGVVFLGGAVLSRLKMSSELDDYRTGCAQQLSVTCNDPEGRSRIRTWETLSWISGGLGLAAVGVGVTLLVATPSTDSKKTALTVTPATFAGGPGVFVEATF